MNTCNDHSVWSLDLDYCSDESGCSAEYKLDFHYHRLLGKEESNTAKTIYKRQMSRHGTMNRTFDQICNNGNTKFEQNINIERGTTAQI